MLLNLFESGIQFFDSLYVDYVAAHIQGLLTQIGQFTNYTTTFQNYLAGVYFVLGKPLCIYFLTTFFIILAIRLIMAIVNIVGQFIP